MIVKEFLMNLKVRFWLVGLALVGATVLSACGGGGTTGGGGNTGGGGATLNVIASDIKYDQTSLSAKAGTPTTVSVKNNGPSQHNWVLVKPEDAERVDQEALAKNGDATGITGVLAGGKLIAVNATDQINFNVPAGTYTYLCTFPAHYQAGMKGTLTVQ